LAACAGLGRFPHDLGAFTWASDLEPAPPEGEYVLGPGDLVAVRVFNQEALSARVRVRRDGRISLPLLGETHAAGFTPQVLANELGIRLVEYVTSPSVTVTVEEQRALQIPVLGEVARPGLLTLDVTAGVLQAVAAAGGLTEFGHRDRVLVLRPGGRPDRIRFDLDRLVLEGGGPLRFRLQAGDSVVVE
jgi:polysaccharide export outer membrane protein